MLFLAFLPISLAKGPQISSKRYISYVYVVNGVYNPISCNITFLGINNPVSSKHSTRLTPKWCSFKQFPTISSNSLLFVYVLRWGFKRLLRFSKTRKFHTFYLSMALFNVTLLATNIFCLFFKRSKDMFWWDFML